MIADLLKDVQVLAPGDRITVGGLDAVTVYPLALWHVGRFAGYIEVLNAVNGVLGREETPPADILEAFSWPPKEPVPNDRPEQLRAALVPVLLGPALPLLIACCDRVPPAEARAATAESWIRQSYGDLFTPDEVDQSDDPGDDGYVVPTKAILAQLIAAGHSVNDIFHTKHQGSDGRPMPFPGWTLRMLSYWVDATVAADAFARANTIDALIAAVGSLTPEGAEATVEAVKKLRSTH